MKILDAGPPVTAREYVSAAWDSWLRGLRLGFEAVLEAGRLLLEAKAKTPHGEFLQALEEGPIRADTAEKLMAISSHPALSNSAHVRKLPPHYSTLYELTRLPEPTLLAALDDGRITPELERHQVRKLWSTVPIEIRPAPTYALFACATCGAHKLVRDESRPSSLGEGEEAYPRLYVCADCGKTTLTWERSGGPFAKKSLPKSSHETDTIVAKEAE